jgi:CRP/FNR family transcriptional regulator
MKAESKTAQAYLARHPMFKGLDREALTVLVREARRRTYEPGQMIYDQGEPGVTCQIILEGRARVFVIGEDGRELSVNILGPGELFGEMALFENLPRSASVEALSPTHTLELDQTVLIRALRRSPNLALGMLRAMSARLRTTTEDAELLASQPVAERLLRRLERLATWSGRRVHDGVMITPPMTQHELATLVGTTRESVNRALVRLRDQGRVRWEDGWIVLVDGGE